MAKQKPGETIPAKLLDMSAGDLVRLLIEAGESTTTIVDGTGLQRSDVSRWRNDIRQASESNWRKLAKYALQKLEKI